MPRDGLSQYAPPPGTNGITNYTIESTKYNGFVADITADQNNPRPIVAGGTGANNAQQAMLNLSGEIAMQVVTNYDSFPFVSGSFYSAIGATSAPVAGHAFTGICYATDANNMVIEAHDMTDAAPGITYIRRKITNWGAWYAGAGNQTALDAAYVNVAGDTMTGNLMIQTPGGSALALNKTTAVPCSIVGYMNGLTRWSMDFGDGAAESGSNAGSNFYLRRYNDAGAQIDTPISISRATGAVTITQALSLGGTLFGQSIAAAGTINAGSGGTTGTYYFGNSGTKSLSYDGTSFNLVGGSVAITDPNLYIGTSGAGGVLRFGPGTKYLQYDGTNFNFVGGGLFTSAINASGRVTSANDIMTYNGGGANGTVYFGNGGSAFLTYQSSVYSLNGGQFNINHKVVQTSPYGSSGLVGYAYALAYGGGTEYGMSFHPTNDANHSAIAFSNAAGSGVGAINCSSTATAFVTSSSAELKEDLKSFDAGRIIDDTNVYDFKWRSTGERSYGVVAQEAVGVYPTAVAHTVNPENKDDEFWGVDYSKYVPVLLQELKALRARVAALEGGATPQPA